MIEGVVKWRGWQSRSKENSFSSRVPAPGGTAMPDLCESNFDTLVVDRENRPIALVVVNGNTFSSLAAEWLAFLTKQLQDFDQHVPFVILVDPSSIAFFRWDGSALTGPVVQLPTPEILRHYEPEFEKRRIFKYYLQTLTEAWLRDLAYHWKSQAPPGTENLRTTDFLSRLEEGTTHSIGR
jgi:hypothetical protein